MNGAKFDVPVVFLVFNRPEVTARVFSVIRAIQPRTLLVVADGPRDGVQGESVRCARVRELVEQVDWDCDVQRNYSDVNLGCKRRVASGLGWAFSRVERAIILEDDCLPDLTFFEFCRDMLNRYESDERVVHIGGTNFQRKRDWLENSYYFSRFTHVWGWASWRRAWRSYDVNIADWPVRKANGWLSTILDSKREEQYWSTIFDRVFAGEIDTWDYQLTYAAWKAQGLSVVPGRNLVSNIGFGFDATHTRSRSRFADINVESMAFPLRHPGSIVVEQRADRYTDRIMFSGQHRRGRLRRVVRGIVRRLA